MVWQKIKEKSKIYEKSTLEGTFNFRPHTYHIALTQITYPIHALFELCMFFTNVYLVLVIPTKTALYLIEIYFIYSRRQIPNASQ